MRKKTQKVFAYRGPLAPCVRPCHTARMEEHEVRQIARDEIASLAGKALRRTRDLEFSRDPARNLAVEVANEQMAQFWGEVLAEYGPDLPETTSMQAAEAAERLARPKTGEEGWPKPAETPETPKIAADYADSAE